MSFRVIVVCLLLSVISHSQAQTSRQAEEQKLLQLWSTPVFDRGIKILLYKDSAFRDERLPHPLSTLYGSVVQFEKNGPAFLKLSEKRNEVTLLELTRLKFLEKPNVTLLKLTQVIPTKAWPQFEVSVDPLIEFVSPHLPLPGTEQWTVIILDRTDSNLDFPTKKKVRGEEKEQTRFLVKPDGERTPRIFLSSSDDLTTISIEFNFPEEPHEIVKITSRDTVIKISPNGKGQSIRIHYHFDVKDID